MVAILLRWVLFAQALALFATGWLLGTVFGIGPGAAAGICAALFVAFNSIIPIMTFAMALRYSPKPIGALKPDLWRIACIAVREWLAFLALFVVIQPFPRWWMAPDRVGEGGAARPPVLLVHGFCCNHASWWWFAGRLRRQGLTVVTVDLEPPFAGMDELAAAIERRLDEIAAQSHDKVVMIGHSMGGLVARAFLRRYGTSRVARLITIGTPHHGTETARLGRGSNSREMEPGSPWLCQLARDGLPDIPVVSIWSPTDNFILPQDSSRLAGAREIVLPGLTHLTMVFSGRMLRTVLQELC